MHVNSGVRGAPLLLQQLQKEVEALRDQLATQYEVSEASAARIRQLEREKEVVTGAFDNRSNNLQGMAELRKQEAKVGTARLGRGVCHTTWRLLLCGDFARPTRACPCSSAQIPAIIGCQRVPMACRDGAASLRECGEWQHQASCV